MFLILFFICWIPIYGSKFDNFYCVFHLLDSACRGHPCPSSSKELALDIWFKIRQLHFILIMLLFSICWIPKYGSKFGKIENEYTKARGIFYDLSDFASGRCQKPGPEPTERRKQTNYAEPLSE